MVLVHTMALAEILEIDNVTAEVHQVNYQHYVYTKNIDLLADGRCAIVQKSALTHGLSDS